MEFIITHKRWPCSEITAIRVASLFPIDRKFNYMIKILMFMEIIRKFRVSLLQVHLCSKFYLTIK
uniref:Uncharacterized protein n=1 Tax=Kalanchoe fedtschenkoi TaxID=63787 RepID=A0A7N0TDN1_KALFE